MEQDDCKPADQPPSDVPIHLYRAKIVWLPNCPQTGTLACGNANPMSWYPAM